MQKNNIRDILNRIYAYETAKETVAKASDEHFKAEQKAKAELDASIREIENVLAHPGSKELVSKMSRLHAGAITVKEPEKYLRYNNALSTFEIRPDNYKETARTAYAAFSRPVNPSSPVTAERFCKGYNTLVYLTNVRDKLLKLIIESETCALDKKAEECASVVREFEAGEIYAHKFAPSTVSDPHGEGRIVIGRIPEKLTDGEKAKLYEYGYGEDDFSTPVMLECKARKGAAHVYLSEQAVSSDRNPVQGMVRSIVYDNLLSYEPGDLSIASAEKNRSNTSLFKFASALRMRSLKSESFPDYIYKFISDNKINDNGTEEETAWSTDTAVKLFDSIERVINHRRGFINNEEFPGIPTVAEYNQKNPYTPMKYIFLIVNGFPKGIEDHLYANEYFNKLEQIIKDGGIYGVFTLLIGEIPPVQLRDRVRQIIPEEFGMETFNYDDIVFPDTDVDSVCGSIIETVKNRVSLTLDRMIGIADEQGFEKPDTGCEINVPIGISDGRLYCFANSIDEKDSVMKGGVNALVLGRPGRGKTAFLRMLILSGAWFYSPDELQFYILDFKSASGTADFACFSQQGGDSYIPHVKFLSLSGGPKHAIEVMKLIKNLIDERSDYFSSIGKKDYKEYMDYRKANPGDKNIKIYPQIYFLIDEYNSIFKEYSPLNKELTGITGRVRSWGINIILSGQHMTFSENISNRVVFDMDKPSEFKDVFEDKADDSKQKESTDFAYSAVLGKIGVAACSRSATTDKKSVVRLAYSGGTEASAVFAEKIRKKYSGYNTIQLIPGSSDLVNADMLLSMPQDSMQVRMKNCYRLYIGLSSMISMPMCMKFGEKTDTIIGVTEQAFYTGYLVHLMDEEKRIRLEMNAMISYLEYLAKTNLIDSGRYISYNYSRDSRSDVSAVIETVSTHGLDRYIKINSDAAGVSAEIRKVYREIYQKRREGEGVPYLLVFHDVSWLLNLQKMIKEKMANAAKSAANVSKDDIKISDVSREKIDSLGLRSSALARLAFISKDIDSPGASVNTGSIPDDDAVFDELSVLFKNGCERNVFVIFSDRSFHGIDNLLDLDIAKWTSIVQETPKEEDRKNAGINPGTCYTDETELRLFDYDSSDKWWAYFDKLSGSIS